MGFKIKMPSILGICIIFLLYITPAISDIDSKFYNSLGSFNKNIFSELFKSNGEKSLIYSPFSIQACLAMLRMGAEGQTAAELDGGLSFNDQNQQTVAENYHTMLSKYENSKILTIANKIYVMHNHDLLENYKEVLTDKFFSSAENIDFSQSENAANAINTWVETKTDNMIKDLVVPDNVNADTRLLLVSAIHFDGKWASAFPMKNTAEFDFHFSDPDYPDPDSAETIKVQMMRVETNFTFGSLSELRAQAVLLPYKDSDLSMLVLVPYSYDGLAEMVKKLENIPLQSVIKNMTEFIPIRLYLPKFKAEFQIDLRNVLQKMGMKQMFGNADFGKMTKTTDNLEVTDVIHKAVIDVSEEGTKAATITVSSRARVGNHFVPVVADHPFFYAIINEDSVPLFQGTFYGV